MQELENIVEEMISQHRTLQKDLGGALDLVKNEEPDFVQIDADLKKFIKDLEEHLKLENDIFYPSLLKKMKEKDVDTSKTEDFINQMKEIGTVVMIFLGKYKSNIEIENQFADFKNDLSTIVSALNLRIESEESGVYGYWGLY